MIENILSWLTEMEVFHKKDWENYYIEHDYGAMCAYKRAKEKVQEVAKQYGNGWTLCNDRLPEEHKLVLIYAESTARGGSIRRVAQLHNGFWFVQTASDTLGLIGQYKVIKWAELPEV